MASTVERISTSSGWPCHISRPCHISDGCPATSGSRPYQAFCRPPRRNGEGRKRAGRTSSSPPSNTIWAKSGHQKKPIKKYQVPSERPRGKSRNQLTVEREGRRIPPNVNNGKAELAALKVQVTANNNSRDQREGDGGVGVAEVKMEHSVGVWGPQNKTPLGVETEEERESRLRRLDQEDRDRLREEMLRCGPEYGRTPVTGQHRQGSSGQLSTFVWSSIADEAGYMQRDVIERTLAYERAVDAMVPERTRFFFVFVRPTLSRTTQAPWDDWTLVAQLAAESANTIDTSALPGQLSSRDHALVAECVQWCRPDIILRRRPQYKIRIEEQEPFFRALPHLLSPLRGSDYYARICAALALTTSASIEQMDVAYQRLTPGARSQLWEIVFGENPGNPLADSNGAEGPLSSGASLSTEGGGWGREGEEALLDAEQKWEGEDEGEELFDVEGDDEGGLNGAELSFGDYESDEEGSGEDDERESRMGARDESFQVEDGGGSGESLVAIRPFDYSNLLKEIVFVQDFVGLN